MPAPEDNITGVLTNTPAGKYILVAARRESAAFSID